MTNYTKKAIKGTSLVFVMVGVSSFFAYLLRIVLARNLSPSDYGLFYAVFTLIMFLLIFRNIGLGSALTKFIAEYKVKKNYSKIKTLITSVFVFQLISSLVLISCLLIISSFLSNYYFRAAIASKILIFLTMYIIISIPFKLISATLVGFQDVKWYSLAEPLRLGIACLSALLFFHLDFKIFSPVFAFITGATLASLILLVGVSKYFFIFKYKIKDFWKTTKQLFKFSIPVIFTGMGNKVVSHLDVLILVYFVSLKGVGIYNVILPTAMALILFGSAVSTVLFPMISELWSKNDKIRAAEGIRLIYVYSFVLMVPLLFTIFAFSEVFIRLLFGSEYVAGITAFRILLIGILFYTVAMVNNTAISGIGKPIIVTKIILISAVINIVFNLLLIPYFKLTGAAIATTISYAFILFLSTIKIRKFIEIPAPWKNWLKTFFAGLVFVAVIHLIKTFLVLNPWFEMTISLFLAGIAYVLLIMNMYIIDIKEIKVLVKRLF